MNLTRHLLSMVSRAVPRVHTSPLRIGNVRGLTSTSNSHLSAQLASEPKMAMSQLNHVLMAAEKMLHESSPNCNLQHLLSEEVSVVTQILTKLVGTNHSLSEIQKLYQSGSTSEHLVRGLLVLLMSKTAGIGVDDPKIDVQTQWVLAKIVEMVHMAVLIHREIRNIDSQLLAQVEAHLQMNLSNKVSVLYGDFLWAKAWKELADMGDIEVIDMMVGVLVNTSQGQFLSELEREDVTSKMSLEYWMEKNFLLTACLPAFGCKSALKLAAIDETLQKHAYEFGQNFGFFRKAYQEMRWFAASEPNGSELLDFCSLPVIMHSIETGQSLQHLAAEWEDGSQSKPSSYHYRQLHSLVRDGPGLAKSRTILDNFRANAFQSLDHFPDSEPKQYLKQIFNAMDC